MKVKNEELINALENFCEIFNLSSPQSNDIRKWWNQAVNEMEIELLYLLYDNNVLEGYENEDIIFMNKLLSNRINDLERIK